MITVDGHSRTSAQIALEDKTFHELFGMIWKNGGYKIQSAQDLSWAILYKDVFLQGLADYVNEGYVKVPAGREFLVIDSAKEWVEFNSPFDDLKVAEELRIKIDKAITQYHACDNRRKKADVISFNRKLNKAKACLKNFNPFSFDRSSEILGLDIDEARAAFKLYRQLKQKHGHSIRIVTYTGNKKKLNIPSLEDIIKAEEANGEQDLPLFLHIGVKRDLRNRALVRSKKNERRNQGDSK